MAINRLLNRTGKKTHITVERLANLYFLIWYVNKRVAFSKALLEIQCILATMAGNNSLFQKTTNESRLRFMATMK